MKRNWSFILKLLFLIVMIIVLIITLIFAYSYFNPEHSVLDVLFGESAVSSVSSTQEGSDGSLSGTNNAGSESSETSDGVPSSNDIVEEAKAMAVQYDFEGAIDLLYTIDGYEDDEDISSLIAEYEREINGLISFAPSLVTHVFFHSLVVDSSRAFSLTGNTDWDNATIGFCEWMTTVDEFNAILQQMYDNGYVLVSIYDMIDKTVDEDGNVHISSKNIYLPDGKTPFVLSLDDLSYYHSYDGRGIASKMIVGDDGTPTCEYIDASGKTLTGSYDAVPLLDDFLDEHPDFSYKGAKGIIALTGYNGVLGYRTDYAYRDRENLDYDQQLYLEANPGFDWDAEVAAAKEVANCIKEDGWIFASHTWGHIRIGDASLESIKADTEKWLEFVEPIVGETDIIIFAHGQDLASWNEDYAATEKFQYLSEQGFDIFCNVDSSRYFVQIGDEYLRMGRRNLDGLRMYEALYEETDRLYDLFNVEEVWDKTRPTEAYLYGFADASND